MIAKPEPTEQRWLRVEEAAVYANVGVSWVLKLIKSGQLPASRIGSRYLIDRHDLNACLESLKEPKRKR